MFEVNIPERDKHALNRIDTKELDRAIERALDDERLEMSCRYTLSDCGPYVAGRLNYFERALQSLATAKSPGKRFDLHERARRAGSDLAYAVSGMKHRLAKEEKEDTLFHVEDRIHPPSHFSRTLSVCVDYRWRRSIDDEWTYGSITFHHEDDPRPDYAAPVPKRKPNVAKQAQDTQDKLYRTWEHLTRGALHSVKEFLRDGGVGSDIPETYRASIDPHSRSLNNHSTKFWGQHSRNVQPVEPDRVSET